MQYFIPFYLKFLILKFSLIKPYIAIVFIILISFFITIKNSSVLELVEQAQSTKTFLDSIGVAVHLNYADTPYRYYEMIIRPRLRELGVRHIRDGVELDDLHTQAKFNDLAQLGIKSTLVMDPRDMSDPRDAIKIVQSLSSSVEAIEGPNEWDIHPELRYKNQNFPEGVRQFQAELYDAIKGNRDTAHLEVLSPSMANPSSSSQLGTVACDVGNMHAYPGGQVPSWALDRRLIPQARLMCQSQLVIASECGYHNAFNRSNTISYGVSEAASAKYLPRLLLEYFNRGVRRAFKYELIDIKPNSEADISTFNFGLLRYNGLPKPEFTSLKNLIYLLRDSDIASTQSALGTLDYTLHGNVHNIHHTLLQKQDGTFYLMFWQEVSSYDLQSKEDIRVPEQDVVLMLHTNISQARIYQPLYSTNSLEEYSNPSQLDLHIPDHLLILELVPNNL